MVCDSPDGGVLCSIVVAEQCRQVVGQEHYNKQQSGADPSLTRANGRRDELEKDKRRTESTGSGEGRLSDDVPEARKREEEAEDREGDGVLGKEGINHGCRYGSEAAQRTRDNQFGVERSKDR
jgi:hypothetical protein